MLWPHSNEWGGCVSSHRAEVLLNGYTSNRVLVGLSDSSWNPFSDSGLWGLHLPIFVTFPDNPIQWLAQCAEVQNLNTVLLSLFMWTTHCNTMNAFEEKLFALRATKMQSSWREVSEAVGHSPLCLVSQNSYKNIYLLKMVSDIAHSSSFEAYWGL